jgi:hypothetical protein
MWISYIRPKVGGVNVCGFKSINRKNSAYLILLL